ncbi:hypothetical protein CKO_02210 [Citrobacter koseri ATCC BAA-895]|uniref:Uncharacterized protein n=1 Tax=Citrobacter koseri (strain ATCC BAA-895 / CDC 4225-83 / SGSC4696) TaxID=290338 RepID=A8AIL9_CITK8|nr:hypothetical protein CKO_02210 [Citrobacter koseri ATCC BAA-895]
MFLQCKRQRFVSWFSISCNVIPVTSLDEDNRYALSSPLIFSSYISTDRTRNLMANQPEPGVNSDGYNVIKCSEPYADA